MRWTGARDLGDGLAAPPEQRSENQFLESEREVRCTPRGMTCDGAASAVSHNDFIALRSIIFAAVNDPAEYGVGLRRDVDVTESARISSATSR